jgi:tetratricopeptide (TPR) repeat protein
MKVIHAEGTQEEIARSLYEQIEHRETLEYFLDFPRRVLGGVVGNNILGNVGLYALKKLTALISSKYGKYDLAMWKEYCGLLGLDYSIAAKSLAYPDMLLYLVGRSGYFISGMPQIYLGCSSLAVKKGDGIVHGRNLDFYGGRYWTRDHSLIVLKPKGRIASITLSADGLPLPGLTSINEEGIAVSLHVLFTRRVSLSGEPALSIVSELISTCRSISEVRSLLSGKKTSGGWGILVTDGKTSECSVFEMNNNGMSEFKVTENKFSYANMALTPEKKADEFVPAYLWVQNNHYRKKRMDDMLNSMWFGVDHIKMFKILGDFHDIGMNRDLLAGHSIANSNTISSATFNFAEDRIAVADGTTPAPTGAIHDFSISDLFAGKSSSIRVIQPDAPLSEAMDTYVLSGCEYSENHNYGELVSIMSGLKQMKQDEYAFPLFLAVSYAKLGEYTKALEYAEETLHHKLDHYREGVVLLMCAMFKDISGRRTEAVQEYENVLKNYRYPCLTRKSLKYFSTPCRGKDTDRLELNWFMSFVLLF